MANIIQVTDSSFEAEVIQAKLPVIVDFGAEWCRPCRQLDPIVDELAAEWEGKVKVVKVDVDASVQTAMTYGVMGVPTLIVFVHGEAKERVTGYMPRKRILDKLGPSLGV